MDGRHPAGLRPAWPRDVEDALVDVVDDLIERMYSWARDPWKLDVWESTVDSFEMAALSVPKKGRLLARAAARLETGYRSFFFDLADI